MEDDDDNNEPMVHIRSSGESREPIKEVNLDVSSRSVGDIGLIEDDPLIIQIPLRIMTLERMGELVSRYRIPLEFMCRIPNDGEYIFTPNPLEVVVCEETF